MVFLQHERWVVARMIGFLNLLKLLILLIKAITWTPINNIVGDLRSLLTKGLHNKLLIRLNKIKCIYMISSLVIKHVSTCRYRGFFVH